MKKTLILTIDMQGAKSWQINALSMQICDWFKANRTLLPNENIIIMPANTTKLFWLEGEHNSDDIKTLEQIKDRITPVLELALEIKIDKKRQFIDPYRKNQHGNSRFSSKVAPFFNHGKRITKK
jgi:hypothetical protein